MTIEETISLLAVSVVGIGLLAYSIQLFYKIRLIKNSDEISVAEAINRDNIVQIYGRAYKNTETVASPIENDECLAYEYDISKTAKESANPDHDYGWKSVEEEAKAVDFILEDHSGTAYIRTDGADISLTHDRQHTVANSATTPSTVPTDSVSLQPTNFNFSEKLRYTEGTISEGDRIFVIGKFTTTAPGESEDIEISYDETMFISDKDTGGQIKSLRRPAVNSLIFGAVFLLFAVSYIGVELL